jgi:hypothetical protein
VQDNTSVAASASSVSLVLFILIILTKIFNSAQFAEADVMASGLNIVDSILNIKKKSPENTGDHT